MTQTWSTLPSAPDRTCADLARLPDEELSKIVRQSPGVACPTCKQTNCRDFLAHFRQWATAEQRQSAATPRTVTLDLSAAAFREQQPTEESLELRMLGHARAICDAAGIGDDPRAVLRIAERLAQMSENIHTALVKAKGATQERAVASGDKKSGPLNPYAPSEPTQVTIPRVSWFDPNWRKS